MRVLAATLAVLLFVAFCTLAEADPRVSRSAALPMNETGSIFCCYRTISLPIPRRLILSAYLTSTSCPEQAVVLVTKKGRQVCANPNAPWVQKYLKRLESLEY